MSEQWIAETMFVLRRRDGSRTPVRIAIGAPRQVGEAEWNCALSLQGAYDDVAPVVATDAIQSLGLAWDLARQLLSGLEIKGETLEYESGEAVPLSAYFEPSRATSSSRPPNDR